MGLVPEIMALLRDARKTRAPKSIAIPEARIGDLEGLLDAGRLFGLPVVPGDVVGVV